MLQQTSQHSLATNVYEMQFTRLQSTNSGVSRVTASLHSLISVISFFEFKDVHSFGLVNKELNEKLINYKREYSYINKKSSILIAFYVKQLLNFNDVAPWKESRRYVLPALYDKNELVRKISTIETSLCAFDVKILPFSCVRYLIWSPSPCDNPDPKYCLTAGLRFCEEDHQCGRFQLENFKALETLTFFGYESIQFNSERLTRMLERTTGLALRVLVFSSCDMRGVNLNALTKLTQLKILKFSYCQHVVPPNITSLKLLNIYSSHLRNGEFHKDTNICFH